MLSEQTMAVVKSTAPALAVHGEALTRHFYQRMFQHHPEVAPFFNPANQAAGLQQKALAGAICAYAANIDNLGALGAAVELIAQKHASLQIKPAHYPIVGEHLLASIKEVLGAGATEAVIHAWGEAYRFLADIMIAREQQIYTEQANMPGGWVGFKPFRVIKKEAESPLITSFYLVPEDGNALPLFKPGQYITLRMQSPSGHTTMRNYSLSDMPGQPWFRISVKREDATSANTPAGFVSHVLHDKIAVGSTIELAPPCGEFCLDLSQKTTKPLVFLAAGVGITPIFSMLQMALDTMPDRQIILMYGSVNEASQAFKPALDQLAAQHSQFTVHYCYSQPTNHASIGVTHSRINAVLMDACVPQIDADYYFCGPQAFMTSIYQTLIARNVPASQLHFEFFGPRQSLENTQEKAQCPF